MSVELVMPSNYLIFCLPLFLLPSIFPRIRVFSNESALYIRWPKYWSFSFSISLPNGYSGLISFRIDWFDLLAVQGTIKSLLQHHSLKPLILWCSAFFMVHLSHSYMTTGKTIALTILDYWSYKFYPFSSPGDLPRPRDRTYVSCIAGRFFTTWSMEEGPFCLILWMNYY